MILKDKVIIVTGGADEKLLIYHINVKTDLSQNTYQLDISDDLSIYDMVLAVKEKYFRTDGLVIVVIHVLKIRELPLRILIRLLGGRM